VLKLSAEEWGTTSSLRLWGAVAVRVHDSTADLRYMVLPMRPAGTQGWAEERLARLVTRDSMIGVCAAADPSTLL